MSDQERNANVVLTADVSGYNQDIIQAERNTAALLTAVTGVTTAMSKLAQSSGKSIQLVGAGTVAGLTAATAAAARFQSQTQQLEASAAMAGRGMSTLERDISSMRSEVNMSTGEITSLFTQLNKMGQGGRPIGQLAGEFVKLGAITGESIPALANGLVNLQRQMGTEGVENTRKYTSVLATLSTNAGVSATAITDFANAIAPVAQLANVSQQEVMGFSTVFAKAGADGYAGANAFNKILTDITRSTQFGGPELKAYANLIGVTTDQFKEMGTAESVTRVFEEITSQGPQAIKTLEQFGLDGMRTYKAFVSVANQGGFREALGLAEEGGSKEGIATTAEAARKAMAGLEDEIGKLSNTLGRIGQSFGVGLLRPLEATATALNTVLTPLADLLQMLGSIPGVATAAGAAALIAGGSMVRAIPTMLGIAGVAQVARSGPVAGWNAARRGATPEGFAAMPPWQQRITSDITSQREQRAAGVPLRDIQGRSGMFQRGLFRLGEWAGTKVPGGRYDPDGGPGLARRGLGALNRGAGMGINLAGWLTRIGLDPLRPDTLRDITKREQLTSGWHMPRSYFNPAAETDYRHFGQRVVSGGYGMYERGRQGMRSAFGGLVDPPSAATGAAMGAAVTRAAGGATAWNPQESAKAADAETTARRRHAGVIGSTTRELAKLTVATTRATAGLAAVGAGVAGTAAVAGGRALGRGIASAATGTMGLIGGPAGAALLGGMWVGSSMLGEKQRYDEFQDSNEPRSTASVYRTALGEASAATQSFADAVKMATNQINSGTDTKPTEVSEEDKSLVRTGGYEYTDSSIGKMSREQARVHASMTAPIQSDKGKQLLKLDLFKRFRDEDFVNEIMGEQTPDIAAMMEDLNRDRWWQLGVSGATMDQAAITGGTIAELLAALPERDQAAGRRSALVEAGIGGYQGWENAATPGSSRTANKAAAVAISQMLGTTSDEDIKHIERVLMQTGIASGGTDAFGDDFIKNLSTGDTAVAETVRQIDEQAGLQGDGQMWDRVYRDQRRDPYESWQVLPEDLLGTKLGRGLMSGGQWSQAGATDIQSLSSDLFGLSPGYSPGVMSPQALQGMRGDEVAGYLTDAFTSDMPGVKARAEHELAQYALEESGGDYAQADRYLQEFGAALGDTEGEFYALVQSSRSLNSAFQQMDLSTASLADQASAAREARDQSAQWYAENPTAPGARNQMIADEQRFTEAQAAQRARNMQIVVGKRELDIGLARQTEDFERSMGYRQSDYDRSRRHASEDRDIMLARQETDFNKQLSRTYRDYNLSRDRSEEDFFRSRRRQDESYGRQLMRTHRDFNISRERQEYEFYLGRERQDEAYNRQLTRSWRDFNISRERGEHDYQLQRERGQQQFDKQVFRAQRDFDRQRERQLEDYNLSRERQEEDFNHQVELMARNTAKNVYNIYERVAVARTLSGQNIVQNMADQQRRLEEQNANLDRARSMGLDDKTIEMLGLGDAANAQQLARLIQDMGNDPALVEALNKMVEDRTKATKDLITDSSNEQWKEMERQYKLSVERSAEDFEKAMQRQSEDFARGLKDMREDYQLSLEWANDDFIRSRQRQREDFIRGLRDQREEYKISLEQSLEDYNRVRQQQQDDFARGLKDQRDEYNIQMSQALEDYNRMRARQQADFTTALADQRHDYNVQLQRGQEDWSRARSRQQENFGIESARMYDEMARMQERATDDFNRNAEEIVMSNEELAEKAVGALSGLAKTQFDEINSILNDTGSEVRKSVTQLAEDVNDISNDLGLTGIFVEFKGGGGGGGGRVVFKAEGGEIPGYSPHSKADNIPVMATAGEYMQPVHTVQHYGLEVMEAMREKRIPKEVIQGFADGGLIGGNKKATLVNFGRWLQQQGYHVGEHPLFGGVHPTAHLPTSRGGLHYTGGAIDVNYDGYGQARENQMLDRLMQAANRVNLGYIWRSAGHYGHAHFDISPRRRLNGRMIRGFGGWGGGGGGDYGTFLDITTDDDGNVYDKTSFEALNQKKGFKSWEKLIDDTKILDLRRIPKGLSKAVAMKIAEVTGGMMEGDDIGPGGVPGGVERWRSMVLQALKHVGQPATLADITLRRMNQESSGNPRAINLWDINAKNGTPSKGLMQVIDPTFRAYRDKSLDNDIWNPFANIVASMRYALSRYGSLYKAYARAGGYAEGGEIKSRNDWYEEGGIFPRPTKIGVGENGPEMVLPLNGRGAEFLSEVMLKNQQANKLKDAYVSRNSVPEVSKRIVNNYQYDHSTNFTGPVSVQASDPDEMARKLEMKKRHAALIGRS